CRAHDAREHRNSSRIQAGALLLVDARISNRRTLVLEIGQRVDWLGEADALLAAADAGMARAHWPGLHARIAEQHDGAVGVGFRTFAAEFVQAVPLAVAFVAEFQREAARVEMGAALAVLVDEPAVGEQRAALAIDGRKLAEGQEVNDASEEVIWVRRAARNAKNVVAAERFRDANG